jgi:hypothetical protein
MLSIALAGGAARPPLAITTPALAPRTNADLWIGLAIAAVVLIAAAAFALRRSLQPASAAPGRLARIAVTACAFAAALTLIRLPFLTAYRPLGASPVWAVALAFAVLAVAGSILFGLLDLLLGLFRPHRVALWLMLAPLCFLAVGAALIAVLFRYSPFPFIPNARQLLPAAAIVAAALVWWAWLPTPPRQVAEVFE